MVAAPPKDDFTGTATFLEHDSAIPNQREEDR